MSFSGTFVKLSFDFNAIYMIEATKYIWMDGELTPWEKAKIHVLSHSLHYGGGVFEGIRCYQTKKGKIALFRPHEHVKRLMYSASVLHMDLPYTNGELLSALKLIVRKNNLENGYIRPLIFYGYGKMGLLPTGAPLHVCIACWPWESYLGDSAIRLYISSYRRINPKTTDMQAKICGHYTNSILAGLESANHGYDEALLLDCEGNIAEGPGENIFMVRNGALITPSTETVLKGITRDTILQLAKDMNIPVHERAITPDELKKADEVFLTGTAAEITPVRFIDKVSIGGEKVGSITHSLKSRFTGIINGEDTLSTNWLYYV